MAQVNKTNMESKQMKEQRTRLNPSVELLLETPFLKVARKIKGFNSGQIIIQKREIISDSWGKIITISKKEWNILKEMK